MSSRRDVAASSLRMRVVNGLPSWAFATVVEEGLAKWRPPFAMIRGCAGTLSLILKKNSRRTS